MSLKKAYREAEIIENISINESVKKISIKGDFKGGPGQFYMIKPIISNSLLLPRPLSIHNLYEDRIEFMYLIVGKGTEILAEKRPEDKLSLMGPLGKGFDMDNLNQYKNLALVGGGIGLAPLDYLARLLTCDFDFYGGFKDQVYLGQNIKTKSKKIYISTEDGSQGHQGLITEIIDEGAYEKIIACGPKAMLEAVYQKLDSKDKLTVSTEEHMACGIGLCYACTCDSQEKMPKRVCIDGPVFKGEEIYGI